MAEISQKTKYVKLDDGVSFELVRTNPKLTTNTKLMYNGKRMYMESYTSGPLMNRTMYKNVSVKQNSTYNKDIANFLVGTGTQAYNVYQNFSNIVISDSYDNQFETIYWCGAEYIDSSFYSEEIGFVAPLYLREKLPNYFLIFKLDTPSNYNLNVDEKGKKIDSIFDFKTDILDKAVLIKTFDLREGSVLGNYIHNYIEQDSFEFDKSMYVNFSNGEVTYYGINKSNGVLEKKVENFEHELLINDSPILNDDKWFTEGFERNGLIFPYIMNIEYLFDDDTFKNDGGEIYDFARYIGVYCNTIEFGEFSNLNELTLTTTKDNIIYYFEDINGNLHRYTNNESGLKIDCKNGDDFDKSLISGFEKERITGYAEPIDIYEGFINRAQYGFEIVKPFEPGDWVGIEYDGHFERYFADDKNINIINDNIKEDMSIGEYSDFRFSVNKNSTIKDIAKALVKSVNNNKESKFEASCSGNFVVFYAKKEGKEYNNAKMLMEESLLYNKKISIDIFNKIKHVVISKDSENEKILFGDYYADDFCGACNAIIDPATETYKNVFKIYNEEYVFFGLNRYLKTNNGNGRKIVTNMIHINAEGIIDPEYRIVIVDDAPKGKEMSVGYNISVSSTYQVEIMDIFKPNYGVLSWFPVKDFDFDINYSSYGQYKSFVDECDKLSKKVKYEYIDIADSDYEEDSDYDVNTQDGAINEIKELAKSPFVDGYGNSLETEYEYYFEQLHPDLCLLSKTTPYISKWGYYDEQKDSCENPYRLNINKVFGVSNLSANTFLINCDEKEYTHSMPYYMTFSTPDYYKNYQYIASDEDYIEKNKDEKNKDEKNKDEKNKDEKNKFNNFSECVDYWISKFKRTDVDNFSKFFSGKKYGKRFDRKYSRLMHGDKFHNPSTLFRGVKFEAIRLYNGLEKRSSEYNDYKFSFVYIPVMIDDILFSSTVHFVKNDTFKFIIGIVFVNTMLGSYGHNIFRGDVDYFNKGFLYSACKDIIRPENIDRYKFNVSINTKNDKKYPVEVDGDNIFWKNNIGKFYMWFSSNDSNIKILVTKTKNVKNVGDIVGELYLKSNTNIIDEAIKSNIKNIKKFKSDFSIDNNFTPQDDVQFKLLWNEKYNEYDVIIYGYDIFDYYGEVTCEISAPNIKFSDIIVVDVCDIQWKPIDDVGYDIDVSSLHFKSESLQNVLINMGEDCVVEIKFVDGKKNFVFENGINSQIKVNTDSGDVEITLNNSNKPPSIRNINGNVENLKMTIEIKDKFDVNLNSFGLKDYFKVFNQLSANSIAESINNDYNVKYYSTVVDNKYKIRVIDPDSIEIKDIYEAFPVEITQNNKKVVGSVEIKEKTNVDEIGIKVINRYSGFYNPIFNDILYFDDYITNEKYEFPYSNTNIDYEYNDGYGEFGVIRNIYYHKTNINRSNNILTSENPVYPAINEYALDYRDYNIFSSSWDEGYFISQDDLDTCSICDGIGSMKEGLCMFGSKYLNLPDDIFIDTFENGEVWNEKIIGDRDNTDIEIMYKEINNKTVRYHLFIEKQLKRYLKESLMGVFEKYINKTYSFGNKGTIEDDVEEYIGKNLLKLYKVDKVYMYIKSDKMSVHDKHIENEYLKYTDINNDKKISKGFPVISVDGKYILKESQFVMSKVNEFDRTITYNLKPGFKESFGFGVSFKRK